MELTKIIKKLETLAKDKTTNIFIGGSYALKHYYGLLDREPGDLDIIIYEFTKEQFDWLNEHFTVRNNDHSNIYDDIDPANTCSIFYIDSLFNGEKKSINFIVYKDERRYYETSSNSTFPTMYGIPVLSLKAIIDAKLEYNRNKDANDILKMINKIMTPTQKHLSRKLYYEANPII